MTAPLTGQPLALRATLEAALRTAADQCTADCPAECRTHHPSIFAGGMTAGGLAESIDGDIDAIAHVAAIAAQAEVTRLRAELEQARTALAEASCPLTCPCRSTPLPARWDKTVVPPNPADTEDTDTLVCCIADNGQPIALWLDDGQRETLGLMLIYPGEMDLTPGCSCHAETVHQAGCDTA